MAFFFLLQREGGGDGVSGGGGRRRRWGEIMLDVVGIFRILDFILTKMKSLNIFSRGEF